MTAHRLRLFHSQNGSADLHAWLSQWLTNMQPWSADGVTNSVPELRDNALTDTPYYAGELAFEWSQSKAIILDNIHQYAQSYCDWHRLGYHVCTHDDADPQPCSWETTRESGSPPNDVPKL